MTKPRKLYRFRSLRTPEEISNLETSILTNTLYFSKIKNFNDVFEVHIQIKKGKKHQIMDYVQKLFPVEMHEHALDHLLINHEDIIKSKVKDFSNLFAALCLTTDAFSEHMWAHYADGAKGVCLEFENTPGSVFQLAEKIHYSKKPLVLDFFNNDFNNKTPFLTKSVFYKAEQEYRIFCEPIRDNSVEGKLETYPELSLKRILLGPRFSNLSFLSFLKENRPGLIITKLKTIEGSYKFGIDWECEASSVQKY